MKHWDSGAQTWDRTIENPNFPHYFYYHEADLYIADMVKGSKLVLELGCGTCGSTIKHVSDQLRIVVIDYSRRMIELGRAKIREAGVSNSVDLVVADVCHPPFKEESFDSVFSRGVALSYASKPEAFAHESYRVLKAGGSLGIDFMNKLPSKRTRLEFCRFERVGVDFYYVEQFREDGKQKRIGYRLPRDFTPSRRIEGTVFGGFRSRPDWISLEGLEKEEWWAAFFRPSQVKGLMRSSGFKNVKLFPLGCFTYGLRNPELARFLQENRSWICRLQKDLAKVFRLDRAVLIFLSASKP